MTPASKTRFEAVATEHGLSPSEFLRQVIETVSGEVDAPDQRPAKARREGKVTVRLGQEVRQALEREAQSQHVPGTKVIRMIKGGHTQMKQPIKSIYIGS